MIYPPHSGVKLPHSGVKPYFVQQFRSGLVLPNSHHALVLQDTLTRTCALSTNYGSQHSPYLPILPVQINQASCQLDLQFISPGVHRKTTAVVTSPRAENNMSRGRSISISFRLTSSKIKISNFLVKRSQKQHIFCSYTTTAVRSFVHDV